ncbi:TetR family transcriptional regulator [Saccharothrix saharensis]|uniref:TetR family transcriptional regulator n=1 Tax=Saccharothrix saharensis TaxID=571190 RepID=A0A543JL65_9PSEU|nr:TetR family transcriptional regulator [Saccharothrix saharensis]TQM83590.1 TetR family transcriptional regulator [Saccharothrix saharensis]
MAGDAGATRRRLLDAAAAEFAEHGIAGARVDRIAAAAKSNKAQIYHYFTNKDGLFDAVMSDLAQDTLREAPIDPANLAEYAGRLFDRFTDDPVKERLAKWYRLEGAGYAAVEVVVAGTRDKIAAIAKAQDEGLVTTRFTPVELLALVVHLSALWGSTTPEMAGQAAGIPRERRRQVVVDAVAAVLAD